MEKVKYEEIIKYGWECPSCGGWNEEDDDPAYSETATCSCADCGEEFEAEPE